MVEVVVEAAPVEDVAVLAIEAVVEALADAEVVVVRFYSPCRSSRCTNMLKAVAVALLLEVAVVVHEVVVVLPAAVLAVAEAVPRSML